MKEVYLTLFEEGWTLRDIDEMDFFFYLDLIAYKAKKDDKKRCNTIDQLF
jgi:hypothetical protein